MPTRLPRSHLLGVESSPGCFWWLYTSWERVRGDRSGVSQEKGAFAAADELFPCRQDAFAAADEAFPTKKRVIHGVVAGAAEVDDAFGLGFWAGRAGAVAVPPGFAAELLVAAEGAVTVAESAPSTLHE